ncbi:MAG: ABC transporter permease [Acidimicrobiaceae bacterium]|nr:ABC transporter permease [Acidimicrobiaceae bacterium]MYE97032.1 ABC transporter permease [Acidimicrobiaceae bacterium]MYH44513.1 ABC transporter permease [Acidimicrobiaceae bacterium]MYI53246.1 ABC transporter permease [Acidimicrobiaceae bacterium]MYJ41255.1 ABC transporter permease [Acidimicrobiaceae bacterium]
MQPAGRTSESTAASGEKAAAQAQRRQGMLLASPGALYLLIFFVAPLALITVYSFATRTSTGRTSLSDWNVESYRAIGDDIIVGIVGRSAWLATLTTALCLAVGYPFAYYLATRPRHVRAILLVLVMIPFWTNGLVRVFAIRFLLGSNGPASALSENLGFGTFRILFTPTAVTIGMVYSFLTFMVLPLYVSLERMDWSLTEAARDLYASGSKAFWKVTLPLTKSGIVAGSVLVFVPSFGSYVVPDILGGAKTLLIGSYIARQFRDARNYPLGAALSVLLIVAMLVAVALNQRSGSGAEGGDRPRRRRRGRARGGPEPAAVS